ncbi:hypothetical protein [Paractinoplanes maris]|uniref:hypothetical protein n=1 Tax=Paractinoplanes maris TaxID=1734446 RepID=UPI0020213E22|nr:hypothetical protein [Actinoplanes maris]
MTTSLRTGAVLMTAVLAALTLACTRAPGRAEVVSGPIDLHEWIAKQVASMSATGPYRDPDRSERESGRKAFDAVVRGDLAVAEKLFGDLGFRITQGTDLRTGRAVRIYWADPETGWGGLLVDPSAPARSVVEVPHPAYDLNTEKLGLSLYRALPGSLMLMAGAQRQAAGGEADVAHNDRSMFQVFAVAAAGHGLPQLQLHGFADRSLPGADAVVSTGSAAHNDLAVRIARELEADDRQVCRAWVSRCTGLEGRTNVQGAAAGDAEFIHLELGWSLRRDLSDRDRVRDAVVAAWA